MASTASLADLNVSVFIGAVIVSVHGCSRGYSVDGGVFARGIGISDGTIHYGSDSAARIGAAA
jgi:hypothetical protein